MNEQQQAKQIETYIHALRQNPNAMPPAGLDEATASFTRKLVATQYKQQLNRKVKEKMWQSALNQASQSVLKENHSEQRQKFASLTWVASLIIMLLIGGAILFVASMPRMSEDDPDFGAAAQLASVTPADKGDATATQSGIEDVFLTGTAIIRDATATNATEPPSISVQALVTPTPGSLLTQVPYGYVPVITAFVEIPAGARIREDMLVTVLWPDYQYPSGSFATTDLVVDKYANVVIPRFMPILDNFLVNDPAEVGQLSQITIVTPTPVATTTPTFVPSPTFIVTPTPAQ